MSNLTKEEQDLKDGIKYGIENPVKPVVDIIWDSVPFGNDHSKDYDKGVEIGQSISRK